MFFVFSFLLIYSLEALAELGERINWIVGTVAAVGVGALLTARIINGCCSLVLGAFGRFT